MKDLTKLKELVVEKIKLADLMLAYKVAFAFNPKYADAVQYKCPFHGQDNKPSARLYNTTNTSWCWVCRKAWDPISFIMDKEKMSFIQAIKYLIDRYHIDASSIPDEPTIELKLPEFKAGKLQNAIYETSETSVLMKYLNTAILELRQKISFEKYSSLCGAYCMAEYIESTGKNILDIIKKIEEKISCLRESSMSV